MAELGQLTNASSEVLTIRPSLSASQIVKPILDGCDQYVAGALIDCRRAVAERSGAHQTLMRVTQHRLNASDFKSSLKGGFGVHGCIVASTGWPVAEFRHTVRFIR